MKKLFMLFTAFVLSLSMMASAEAKTVQVTALEDFNAANPPQVLHVQMNANTRLDYDLMLFQGFQVTGKVQARDGGFVFIPVSYVNYHEESLPIQNEYPAVFKGQAGLIRQNQPFHLVFPNNGPDTFQYYVPSVSDMN
ncbi:hypothetical protein J6A64_00780 [bacterium]|nr:hypothetical protein [bacterium]MBO5447508.1 hypothetical protein [bacterium]